MRNFLLKLFGCFLLLTAPFFGMAQKTDKVSLKNGDILTGEIKKLKFGKLSFDMTGPGMIDIKWEEIVKIRSDKKFQVTMRKGEVLITSIDSLFFNSKHVSLDDIVEIIQIKDQFLKRLDGNVDLGLNYSKSSDIFQFNFGSSITYRRPNAETNLKVNSVISSKSTDSFVSKKQDATLEHSWTLQKRYYVQGTVGWQQNTQLGLYNRFALSGVGGKVIFNDNQQRLVTGAGLSFNIEESNKNIGYVKNMEALATIQFKKFRYSSPKISLDTKYTIYPNITDWGRVRMDLQFNLKYEIFKDFNIGLNFYDLYDNRPPSTAASKNDFGVNFTVGYEFGK